MRYAVIGGDARFAHLARLLGESERTCRAFFQPNGEENAEELKRFDCFISNWPMKLGGRAESEVMENILPGSVMLLCGPSFPKERRWDLQYENLWLDEELLTENARLTAEGAAASAMRRTSEGLRGKSCLVIGFGRIGRALVDILHGFGAEVCVYTHSEGKLPLIRSAGARACTDLREAVCGQKIIFSTPPEPMLAGELLDRIDRDALIIDLASPPYGVDLDEALSKGLNAVREPGLPGRFSPLRAGTALKNAVLRWEERDHE